MPGQKQNNKIVIGLTGSFGSGKSTVAGIFASYGARVIDADKIAHACIRRGGKVYKKIILCFGSGVTGKNGEINRSKLAVVVFNNKKLLEKLNRIVHPEVIRIIKSKINSIKKGVIVLDAPLLLEAGLKNAVDKLVVVVIDYDEQVRRIIRKTRLKEQEALKRIKFQIPQNVKSRFANFVIDNSGTVEKTREQVRKIIMQLIPRPGRLQHICKAQRETRD